MYKRQIQGINTIVNGDTLKAASAQAVSYTHLDVYKRQEGTVRGEVVSQVEKELFALYSHQELDVKPKQLEQRGGARYSDAACNLIQSIYNDTGDIQYVDVRNNGAISNLPHDSAVEVACRITADGPKPIATGELKCTINGYVQMMKSFERMVVEAAVTGLSLIHI